MDAVHVLSPYPHLRPFARLGYVLGGWPRRVIAGGCFLLAALTAVVHPTRPAPVDVAVVVTNRDLAAGTVLRPADLRAARWPPELVPPTAITDPAVAVGHPIGAAMARGEPLTRTRMLDRAVLASLHPGQVAATVRVDRSGAANIVQAGSTIDLYSSARGSTVLVDGAAVGASAGRRVATHVRVVAVVAPDNAANSDYLGLVVAIDDVNATTLARDTNGVFLATLVPPP